MADTIFKKIKWAAIRRLALKLPDCKTITPLLGASLDRKTTWREKLSIRTHLLTCKYCERYLKQIRFLAEAMQVHGSKTPSADEFSWGLSTESKARIKDLLRAKAGLAL